MKNIFVGLIIALFLSGCADDDVVEFNKSALHWYKKIGSSIAQGNLDQADKYYISLKSEHIRSPLMSSALMMLAHAHMNEDEYQLANFYLDEYSTRYGDSKSKVYTDFRKLQSAFLGIKNTYKDQKLTLDTIENSKEYLSKYPMSPYRPLVNTILVRLYMTEYLLNENIACLYDRTGKSKAAAICRVKNKNSPLDLEDIKMPQRGFIDKIFD